MPADRMASPGAAVALSFAILLSASCRSAAQDTQPDGSPCADSEDPSYKCEYWAKEGECETNSRFMLQECAKSCGCRGFCENAHPDEAECKAWAELGECSDSRHFMHTQCRLACGCPPECVDAAEYADSCPLWATAGQCEDNPSFMWTHCRLSCKCPKPCVDKDDPAICAQWEAAGECTANIAYMTVHCAATCNTCTMQDYKSRCPMPDISEAAVPPGAMGKMFQRALSEFREYEPQLLSEDPPVIVFDRFLAPDEVAALRSHGEGRYERAMASGGRKDDEFVAVASEIRTAWNTWCNETCHEDPVVKRVTNRMSEVTLVPPNNSELIQFLRYMPCPEADENHPDCQFYRRHHDTIPEMVRMQPGPRVYTFFLYLSDVELGGGTKFDGGFTVQPRAGRAVLWPSTLDNDPFVKDDRTHHEALPVLKGVKFAANFWLHQYDYKTPHYSGCTT